MKLSFVFLILLLTSSCSFDNRSGIWKNDSKISKNELGFFKDFKQIGTRQSNFNEIIEFKKKIIFDIPKKINNDKWEDVYYNQSNNHVNFAFDEKKDLIFKSKKKFQNIK